MRPDRNPKRGSIYPLLDLHGLTGDEAVRRAESWLRLQRDRGERVVILVTGRGNRSAGPPVLRTEVAHLLTLLRGELVDESEPEQGGGAFRVRLSRPAARPRTLPERTAARQVADTEPSLRLRAIEALSELGITATPALLAAEIRRLLRESGAEPREE